MKPTKDNTLGLSIKQECFNDIITGKKKIEMREIKDTTFKKYLETWSRVDNVGLLYNKTLMEGDPVSEIYIYNNGTYPYIPKEYKYLSLTVSLEDKHDNLIVEVNDITFQPVLKKTGSPIRFNIVNDDFKTCKNGDHCFWNIVYHVGVVMVIKRKKSGSELIF